MPRMSHMKRKDTKKKGARKKGTIERALVYDVGMGNGDDSAYYLKKGFDVVGIDASVDACNMCTKRFKNEIASGRMVVLNVGVGAVEETRDFFVTPVEEAISTFCPHHWDGHGRRFERVKVEVQTLSSIVRKFGDPYFIKIDVEFFDHIVLLDLLKAGILPKYISAEAQFVDVYCALVSMGYTAFKLVVGQHVPITFRNCVVHSRDGNQVSHVFSGLSSGPFADDLHGPWLTKEDALAKLMEHKFGWIDVHATRDPQSIR
jgi:FkbM family methyltransferase